MPIQTQKLRCIDSALFLLLILTQNVLAVDFDNGQINNIDSPLLGGAGNARVFDSALGERTTLNALAGAEINGVEANESSLVSIFTGSLITADLNANGSSVVTISGGSLINADALDSSELTISGGTFAGGGGRTIGAFGDAVVNILGDVVLGASTFALLSNEMSTLNVSSGNINGEVRANNDSMINIRGGTNISEVTAVEQSVLRIYGTEFNIDSLGPINLLVPFVISDDSYNGDLLTGTLANGSMITADIFNGISGSQIVLLQAVPLPGAVWLLGSSILSFVWLRRRSPGQ